MQLIFGNKNYSSWSLRPWFLLSYHEVPFDEVRIALFSENYKQRITEYSDAGFVPVLKNGDTTVWDSLAICEYVSETFLSNRGWPEDPKIRAHARACSAEMHSGFPNIRTEMPMNVRAMGRVVEISEPINKEIARIDTMWTQLREIYGSRGPWLFGEFSIADCMFAPIVFRFRTYGISLPSASSKYMETMLEHPAVRRWMNDAENETEVIEMAEVGRQT